MTAKDSQYEKSYTSTLGAGTILSLTGVLISDGTLNSAANIPPSLSHSIDRTPDMIFNALFLRLLGSALMRIAKSRLLVLALNKQYRIVMAPG